MSAHDWQPICTVDEIPVLGARRVKRDRGTPVAIFRTADDKVFALLDRCPHKGGPLSQGIVFGESVACPLHNWTIGLTDGRARAPDEGCAVAFKVRVDAGRVYLDPAELAGLAIDLAPPRAGPCAVIDKCTGALGDQTFEVQAPHSG
jgi:nitrite reductase (NADH) small subunit